MEQSEKYWEEREKVKNNEKSEKNKIKWKIIEHNERKWKNEK